MEVKNTNEKVRKNAKEKRTFVDAIGTRRWKTIEPIPRYPQEQRNIIIKDITNIRQTTTPIGRAQNSYRGRLKSDVRVKIFKDLKQKASGKLEL